jgi:2-oxoisovalerate dehydrogenase E1 component
VLSDKNEYMDPDELSAQKAADPLPRFRAWLIEQGEVDEATLADIEAKVAAEVNTAYETAVEDPPADPELVIEDVYAAPSGDRSEPGEEATPSEQMTFRSAITQALDQAMANDPRVFLMGEDVADSAGGGVFHVTEGLSTTHGEDRVRNTPIAEEAIIGAAVGSAIAGMRPVPEIMFMDFLGVCFDQLSNHAAKLRYMSGGRTPVPMTMRVNMVGGTPIGAQHSQSLEAILMHTPGLKVVFPSTPYDAKGLLLACIEDEDPCVFIESTSLMMKRGKVPTEPYTIPLGKAAIRREGSDVTIIGYGRLMNDVLKAADELAGGGISAEVIDLRSLSPLDTETVLASVAKTRRALVVHEAVRTCGAAAEIATRIHEELHGQLLGPVRRLTSPDSSVPAAPGLVGAFYPNAAGVVTAVKEMTA